MSRWEKLYAAAVRNPKNVRFKELCQLVERAGFVLRGGKGSHLVYRHGSRAEIPILTLQEGGDGKAKPYEVKQVLQIVEEYRLEVQ